MVKRILPLLSIIVVFSWLMQARCLGDASALIQQADGYREEKDYQKAELIYRKVISENPGSPYAQKAQQKLTILYIENSKWDAADAAFQELVSNFAGNAKIADTVYHVADEYVDAKKYKKAADVYQYVADHWPEDEYAIKAQTAVVRSNILAGDGPAAQAATDSLLVKFSKHKDIARAMDQVADEYRRSKQYEKSRTIYQYIVDTWPDAEHAMESHRGIAISSILLADDAGAQAAIDKLITRFSADSEAIARAVTELGEWYGKSGRHEKARAVYELVVTRWPGAEYAMTAQLGIASCYIETGDVSNAQAAFGKLTSVYGGREKTAEQVRKLADGYAKALKYDQAALLYSYAVDNLAADKNTLDAQTNLARMYVSLGEYDKAQAATEKLLTKFSATPRLAASVENVADKYQMAGSQQQAYDLYKRVLTNWPSYERAIWVQTKAVTAQIRLGEYDAADSGMKELMVRFGGDERVSQCVHDIVGEYRGAGEHARAEQLYQYLLDKKAATANASLELRVGMVLSSMELDDEATTQTAIDKLVADFNDNANLGKGLFRIGEKYFSRARSSRRAESQTESRRYAAVAIAVWERIITKWPASDIARDSLYLAASGYELLGEYGQAKAYYEAVVAGWPGWQRSPDAQYHVALCCHKSRFEGAGQIAIDDPVGQTRAAVDKLLKDYPESGVIRAAMNLVGGPEAFRSANSEGENK